MLRLGHEGGVNCLKYLKRGWNRKEGGRDKDFKKGRGQAGLRGGYCKNGGGGEARTPSGTITSLQNKKNLNLCLILQSCHFVAEAVFEIIQEQKCVEYLDKDIFSVICLLKNPMKNDFYFSTSFITVILEAI